MTKAKTLIHQLTRQIALTEPLATISEGHLKATLVNGLLLDGHTIIEGSNRGGKGRRISLQVGKLQWDLVKLPKAAAKERRLMNQDGKLQWVFYDSPIAVARGSEELWNSADIRIVAPEKLVVELQTRCSLGSSSQLKTKDVIDDVERVRTGAADMFVFFLDAEIYNAFRGVKADNRGRKASNPAFFEKLFPPVEELSDRYATFTRDFRTVTHDTLILGLETVAGFAYTRVILSIERA